VATGDAAIRVALSQMVTMIVGRVGKPIMVRLFWILSRTKVHNYDTCHIGSRVTSRLE
jgi:hypothetical protein